MTLLQMRPIGNISQPRVAVFFFTLFPKLQRSIKTASSFMERGYAPPCWVLRVEKFFSI
jgi:hypothetical protein